MNLRGMEVKKLSTLLQNVIQNLDHPERGSQAAELLADIQGEFLRRETLLARGFVPMLACMGYNVHWDRWTIIERRRLLIWIFENELPRLNDENFMAKWGEPGTIKRLRCLYSTLSSYLLRYGNGDGMEGAKLRWQADLLYLTEVARKRFGATTDQAG